MFESLHRKAGTGHRIGLNTGKTLIDDVECVDLRNGQRLMDANELQEDKLHQRSAQHHLCSKNTENSGPMVDVQCSLPTEKCAIFRYGFPLSGTTWDSAHTQKHVGK